MRIVKAAALAFFPVLVAATGGLAAEPAPADSLEGLTQAQLQEAFRVLSQHYIERETLDYEELNKAALDGLLRRLSFGAELVARNGAPPKEAAGIGYHEEIIAKGVAYLRPVTFDESEHSRTAAALAGYAKSGIGTLILDLRSPVEQVEFARAASFADFFTGPNELLFKVRKPGETQARLYLSKDPKAWDKRLVILVDRETSSVAETVAAVIRLHSDHCLVIGERTLGKAVQYEEIPLNESTALRFASAQVLLPDETSLFRKGVAPDLASVTPPEEKKRVFAASGDKKMAAFVFDRERPRMNEAALVAGTNPELEYYLAKSAGKPSPFDRKPLQDRALQTAVESLLAIDHFGSPGPNEPTAARRAGSPSPEQESPDGAPAKQSTPGKRE